MDQAITISVPARTRFVPILRAVTAGVAAALDFSIDEIDDLRLAVDEAVAHLLTGNAACRRITLRLLPEAGHLSVVTSCDATTSDWPKPRSERSMSWHVLSALTDEAALERIDGQAAIRFSKRFPDRAAAP
jgi:serine/threonine-protein kinase RsbW